MHHKNIKKVLITDPIDPTFVQCLRNAGCDVDEKKLTKDQLISQIADYDALVVRSGTQVTVDVIAAGKNLKLIGRAGTGVDNIDVPAATKHGVWVMNTPGANTISAAEMTCALILALARQIPQACQTLKDGRWDRKLFMGNELMGKTLAILGLGRIGREVATRMRSFGMTIVGFDPFMPAETAAQYGIQFMAPEQIWPVADYITVHVPLLPETENLVCSEVLVKCKRGVKIINAARGGIVNEKDLLKELESGQVGGAALDVFAEEPPGPEVQKLLKHSKVVCTPHLGASTTEAQERVAGDLAEQIQQWITTGNAPGFVNKI
ncbi:hypothetical protein RvY_10361 [Ramazzottius varieornatus]|uniref:D-3-phosphoglycerate dehydrogenase n=1 Tax=Ramazzottius varieornatus TaxID=947166 RepID=A0A1D1VH02_RAMVA|nr:hypothetical protein RvY_10361 [Ramazzottius varieornatus]